MAPSLLKCNICPRKPKFSDVSHLLTHLSSKGHLSHYFKLQVRSYQEPQATELLAAYDQWYEKNKLATLLSDRMLAKEARNAKGSRTGTRSSLPVAFPSDISSRAMASGYGNPTVDAKKRRDSLPSFLDPRLSQNYNGYDAGDGSQRQSGPSYAPMSVGIMINPVTNSGFGWNQQHQYQAQEPITTTSMPKRLKDDDETESEGERSPSMGRRTRTMAQAGPSMDFPTHSARRSLIPDPFVDDAAFEYYEDEDEPTRRGGDEASRLKGIFWPGMDIFDSATEEMRRKRNQKKDGSILKQMEETSESVEPTELVFSPNGTLRKQRYISGMVDDSSPLKGETPIPKKRVSRPRRRPLSQLNANAQMQSAQSRYKMRMREENHAVRLEQLSRQAIMYGDSSGTISRGFDNGDGMGYPSSDSHRPRGLAVYRDGNNGPKFGLERSVNKGNGHNKPFYGSFKPPSTAAYRGKENIEPMFTHMGDRNTQQQKFYYNFPSQNDNDAYGYSMNPLSYAAPQQPCVPNHNADGSKDRMTIDTNDLFVQPTPGMFGAGRGVSPFGAMSSIESEGMAEMSLME
ncbi:uncharacterized protein GIQ15_04580 [Arthroderma uncinatum]|uniref:uncharacterized protein n=1 Tax=Arthroderma uncinatum TaxID=74035 RepID=UPI00144AA1AF|nr:uncharacterized protein GIQ15_04580 [Arthroderma uncinatum]KAF3481821.1 hypothetical protein GIQ15_04580 [Arthroderma uncinatum]